MILADPYAVEEIAWWSAASLLDVSVNVFRDRVAVEVVVASAGDWRVLSFEEVFLRPFEDLVYEADFEPTRRKTRLGDERFRRVLADAVAEATRADRHRLFVSLAATFEVGVESEVSIEKSARLWAVRRLLEQLGAELEEEALVQMHREAWVRKEVMDN